MAQPKPAQIRIFHDEAERPGPCRQLPIRAQAGGRYTNAGFLSVVSLATTPTVKWDDVTYFVPGLFYGEAHGGPVSLSSKRCPVREDSLSAPMTTALSVDCPASGFLGASYFAHASPSGVRRQAK